MSHNQTMMLQEAVQSAEMLAKQLQNTEATRILVEKIKKIDAKSFITVARGSSDHAAHFFSYLVMQKLGILTTSLSPSLVTLHEAPLQVSSTVAFGFSQSGASPDLVQSLTHVGKLGAKTVACVNQINSPLEQVANETLSICAGLEQSVAATKSCLGIMTLAVQFVALWQNDKQLLNELHTLAEQMTQVNIEHAEKILQAFSKEQRVLVIGRGLSHSVALEAALKMKETSAIQAEAFSAAEVRHGPMRLIESGYPVVVFITPGEAQQQLLDFSLEMNARGAKILAVCSIENSLVKKLSDAGVMVLNERMGRSCLSETLAPIAALQLFYIFLSQLSVARGLNPDKPLFLNKITQTH